MDLPVEEGTDVISSPRMTNIPRPAATLTIEVGEIDPKISEASQLNRAIEAQPVKSTSIPPQPTYLLSSFIKPRLVELELARIKTLFNIPKKYRLRVAHPREQADWRSPGWV